MKIETHCHSKGASVCADVDDQHIIDTYSKLGYNAIILTNHVNSSMACYPATNYKERIDYYLSCFDTVKTLGEKAGIKVFLGAEIRTQTESGVHQEFLLVGFDREFLYNHEEILDYNQSKLFSLANQNGLFMWQSHPFRKGEELGDARYMHGAEAFNCHFHHDNFNEKAQEFCKLNNLTQMSGTDYHHQGQPVCAGIIVPNDIKDEKSLATYLLNNQPKLLVDQKFCLLARENYLREINK